MNEQEGCTYPGTHVLKNKGASATSPRCNASSGARPLFAFKSCAKTRCAASITWPTCRRSTSRFSRTCTILLGGQPGAGKSALAGEAVRDLLANGGAVVIDADRMREEHQRYKQLSREGPQNAADTQDFLHAIAVTTAGVTDRTGHWQL